MKSIKSAVLAIVLLWGSTTLSRALIPLTPFNFEFEAASGQTAMFNSSSITLLVPLGGPMQSRPDLVGFFDIKDSNVPGGEATSGLASETITSISASGWSGTFTIDYMDQANQPETITVAGNGSTGSITDSDPETANGTWVAVPDQAGTGLLLALAAGVWWMIRIVQTIAGGRLRLMALSRN